jgi:hypothetical protein
VGDGQHPEAHLGGGRLDPAGHRPQGIHVQTRVDLVQDGEPGSQHPELDRLVALAFPSGEVDVERTRQEPLVEADAGCLGSHQRWHFSRIASPNPQRLPQDVGQRHARHLDRVLHGEKEPGLGPLPGRQVEQVDAVKGDPTGGDPIAGPAEQHMRERALARPVRSHYRVHLATTDPQVDAPQDLPAGHLGVQSFDDQLAMTVAPRPLFGGPRLAHVDSPSVTTTSSPSRWIWYTGTGRVAGSDWG